MNHSRRARDLPLLQVDSRLVASAQAHSSDMLKRQYFSHTGKGGSNVRDRMLDQGYAISSCAENIAKAPTASMVFQLWFDSKGHNKIMFNGRYTRVGIAKAGDYWTANLPPRRGNNDGSRGCGFHVYAAQLYASALSKIWLST